MWMAGAGIRPGAYGQTDDIGYYIGENPVGIRDLQATILHLLGLNPHRFNFAYLAILRWLKALPEFELRLSDHKPWTNGFI